MAVEIIPTLWLYVLCSSVFQHISWIYVTNQYMERIYVKYIKYHMLNKTHRHTIKYHQIMFNPIHAELFWRNEITFLHLLPLHTIQMVQVVGGFPEGRCMLCTSWFFTRGQFWPSGIVVACVCLSVCVSVCVCVRQPRACPRHKSTRVQARTTKFGKKVQNNLVKVPIVLGGDWPWPSRSNLTWKAKFTPFWACPRHNSSSIQARTTKFGQKMQTNLLVVHIVLGGRLTATFMVKFNSLTGW